MSTSSNDSISTTDNSPPLELKPVLPPAFALGMTNLCLVVLLSMLFLLLNYVGLRPTDLWCHVAYGDWILTNQTLPTQDPFMPYSEGVEVTNNAWLAQIILATLNQAGGPELLSTTFALVQLASLLVLASIYYMQSRRADVVLFGIALAIFIGWSRLLTIRPEMFGQLAFCAVLLLVFIASRSRRRWPIIVWIGVPVVFALWVNLHGSFACGLALLACFLLGTAGEVAWRKRNLVAVWHSRRVRRWFVLCEFALLACLVNPHGMKLLITTLLFSGNENLRDVLEWQAMQFTGVGGIEFCTSIVVLIVVMRYSRRRVRVAEVLLLAIFTVAAITGVRMMSWYAPVIVFVLIPHIVEIVRRVSLSSESNADGAQTTDQPVAPSGFAWPKRRSFKITVACGLVMWIAFSLSPTGQQLLGGPQRNSQQVYGSQTPLGVSQYLLANPPEGHVFNPQYWGDWLLVDGPNNLKLFSTTMIHLMPRQVWQDYMTVTFVRHGWHRVLDRYAISTVIVDKENQTSLAAALRGAKDWRIAYEDDQALIAERLEQDGQIEVPHSNADVQLVTHSKEGASNESGAEKE